MFCIFNPGCHPSGRGCDLHPPLPVSERRKFETPPPGGPASRLSISLWSKAFIYPAAVPSALSKISWELVQKQLGNIYFDLQKRSNSYPDSAFQSVAFALQRIGFLTWRALHSFFLCSVSRESVSAPCKQCLSTCSVCRKTSKCRCRADWVFLGAVNTPDKEPQHTEDTWCRRKEEKWGNRDESSL